MDQWSCLSSNQWTNGVVYQATMVWHFPGSGYIYPMELFIKQPMDQWSCLSSNQWTNGVVYQATVKRIDNQEEQTYVGITEGAFKTRYNNHTNSFRDPKHKNRTALSKYIWKLKDSKIDFAVSWKIIKKGRGYSSHTKKCNLCLHEKYLIICHPKLSSLNSRNELVSSCRHRRKHLLSNYFNDL